jgi:hypothetical protein
MLVEKGVLLDRNTNVRIRFGQTAQRTGRRFGS